MQCLDTTPILSGPLLTPAGGWAPNEGVQILLEDVPTEWIMRTFDSLPMDFKLSVPYVARIARIDGQQRYAVPETASVLAGTAAGIET